VERAGEWVRRFDPQIKVETIERYVDGVPQVQDLLDEARPTAVMSGIDSPAEVDDWVNAACVARGIPYVRGGMWVTHGIVWSVVPGRSACLDCPRHRHRDVESTDDLVGIGLFRTKARSNRGIGPVAGLLGSLAAFEILRLLTGFEPPAYAGRPVTIDFAAGCAVRQVEWERDPSCPTCGDETAGPAARAGSASTLTPSPAREVRK